MTAGPAAGRCPRCRLPVGSNAFCPHCGRYLAPMTWVAVPPSTSTPADLPTSGPRRYTGPPRYRFIPRWGYLPHPWVEPEPAGTIPKPPARDPVVALRSALATLVPTATATATVALLAAGAEAWRYGLLLASRSDALPAGTVAASDALVTAAGTVTPVLAVVTGVLMIVWTLRAAAAAARHAGVAQARSPREIVVGWVVPGLNLVVPGAVLAEIEHAALERAADVRPRPSRLVTGWWALWFANGLLAAFVVAWSFRDGVQAQADGVVLHALLDLLGAVTAAATAVLVVRLTRLLTPRPVPRRREVLVAVR